MGITKNEQSKPWEWIRIKLIENIDCIEKKENINNHTHNQVMFDIQKETIRDNKPVSN